MPYESINSLMNNKFSFIFVLLLLYSYCPVFCKEYKYLNFTTKDGLSGDNIYSIVQDNNGFIWIATETGLSRFDGTGFKNFTTKDGLPSNEITALFADKKGRVWIVPFKNEICFYYKGTVFTRRTNSMLAQMRLLSENKSIAEDEAGRLLIQDWNGYIIIDINDKIKIFPNPYTGQPLIRPVRGTGQFSSQVVAYRGRGKAVTPNKYVLFNYRDASSVNSYIDVSGEIFVYNDSSLVFKKKKYDNRNYPFSDSIFIVNSSNGAKIYNTKTHQTAGPLLPDHWVNITYIDTEGGIWIGTKGAGLFYLPSDKSFRLRGRIEDKYLQVQGFFPDFGRGFMLIYSGSNQYHLINSEHYKMLESKPDIKGKVRDLFPAKGNILRYAAGGISEILQERKLQSMCPYAKTLSNIGDTLLVATTINTQMLIPGHKPQVIWEGRSMCAFVLDDLYYIGTLYGLYVFRHSQTIHSSVNTKPLFVGTVISFAWSFSNDLKWVITSDNGVYCIRNGVVIKNITVDNGLSSNICTSIYTDGRRVFVGTNNGLNVIDPDQGFLINSFYRLDGLASDNINGVYAEDSLAWVATPEGISVIDISAKHTKAECKLFFTQVSVSGKSLTPDTPQLSLSQNDRDLEIHYSGISFQSMGKIRYHYRMTGLNDEWQITTENFLRYPSLPAGRYRFEIFAVNRFGVNSNKVVLDLEVKKYWWQLLWVQMGGLLLLLAIAFIFIRWRIKKIRSRMSEKMSLQAEIEELEQLALQAQMNPHFIFNSLNSFYQYVINKDLAGASKFMSDFSKLIRLLFEITALKELSLDKEIIFLSTYLELEKTKLDHCFSYDINVSPDLPVDEIIIPSFIIQPFVENSVRHGIQNRHDKTGRIDIRIFSTPDFIVVQVTDNGVGRAHTTLMKQRQLNIHNSRGIDLTTERLALYNKKHQAGITIETLDNYNADETAAGTTVVIKFPIKH